MEDITYHQPLPEKKRSRLKVVCLECNRKFSSSSFIPTCPGCGGSDVELQ
jgi:DNA polymerase II large subunit